MSFSDTSETIEDPNNWAEFSMCQKDCQIISDASWADFI